MSRTPHADVHFAESCIRVSRYSAELDAGCPDFDFHHPRNATTGELRSVEYWTRKRNAALALLALLPQQSMGFISRPARPRAA